MTDTMGELNSEVTQNENMAKQSSNSNQNNPQNKEPKNNFSFEDITKFIACVTACIGLVSLLSTVLLRYANFGSELYFEFDIDYYDFSFSNTFIFEFVVLVLTSTLGILIGTGVYVLVNIISNLLKSTKINIKKKWVKAIFLVGIFLAASFVIIYIVYQLLALIIPENKGAVMLSTYTLFIGASTFGILNMLWIKVCKTNIIKILAILIVGLMILVTGTFVKTEYNNAKSQKNFSIISQSKHLYVVISQGKDKYSAYECSINVKSNTLYIMTDRHRYFNVQTTPTTLVKFKNINQRSYDPITCTQFQKSYESGVKDEVPSIF